MKDALKGVRVLDVTYYVPGPYAGMRLADLGAEVIKIEPPAGDPASLMAGGLVHKANNKGKSIVYIDLKSEAGHAEMMQWVKEADVLLETFRPGVMEKLGLDYASLKRVKPDLIYCSLSGYGQDGPLSLLGSHDLNYMALSGALEQMADTSGRPVHPTNTFADYTGGLVASEQIIAALVKKFRTGEGAYLDIALAEVMAEFQGNHDIYHDAGVSDSGIPEIGGMRISYGVYETKDGRFVTLGALEEKFWQNFCELAEKPQWKSWSTKGIGSSEYEEVASFIKGKTWREWYDLSLSADCCLTPVLKAHERFDHPQFIARRKTVEHR